MRLMMLELAPHRITDKETSLLPRPSYVIINRRARYLKSPGGLLSEQCRVRATSRVLETTSLADLDEAARTIAEETKGNEPPTVVLCGGDGSHMEGVSALARAFESRELPRIALAPGGTVNTVARNWGMRGNALDYSRRLLDSIERNTSTITRRPTLRVEATPRDRDTARGEKNVRLSFIFGAGLVAKFFRIYESRGASGTTEAAKIVARVFAGSFVGSKFARSVLDPVRCAIEVNHRPAAIDRISLLCASVVGDLGLGMRLLYRAEEEMNRFHVVATPLSAPRLGPQMPLVLLGKPLLGPKVDELASSLHLRFESGEGAYVLDGDLFQDADEVTVTSGPALDIVTPPGDADA